MKLSTKGRYGLKAIYFLGKLNDGEIVSLKQLSAQTDVTMPYLEKLLGILKKNNLVDAIRGTNGGYKLSKKSNEITIGEILRALEGNIYLADCNSGKCNRSDCPNYSIFNYIYKKINSVFDELTLEQMIKGENYE